MLDRAKLLSQLDRYSKSIFFDLSNELIIAEKTWHIMANDRFFAKKIAAISSPWLIPTWSELLNKTNLVDHEIIDYTIIGIDGSQIYPDRHQGTSCFLINTGSVIIEYGKSSHVQFFSEPQIFFNEEPQEINEIDLIDCMREEFEFQQAVTCSQSLVSSKPTLLLFDGALIFWHLMIKDQHFKDIYLKKYLDYLTILYEKQFLYAGYISLPKSKELINLIRLQLCNLQPHGCTVYKVIDQLSDMHIMQRVLKPYEYSIIFQNHANITQEYPKFLKPYFIYFNVGNEVARIELPAWIATNQEKVELVMRIIANQCKKGNGYPIVLAEAHEQAVIKSNDRDFFYQTMQLLGIQYKNQLMMSQKSLHKRRMGI